MTRTTYSVALAAAALTLAACGTAGGVTANGAADKPVSLLSLSYNVPGRSGGDQLAKLTELVKALSDDSITLVAGPEPDSGAPDTSAATIKAVRENKAQLGIVSARTFDTLGVTSFQALQAPYLVTSNELADKVLADPLANDMLSGTDPLGVVGIGLAFDFLAYPGGFETPVLGPEDYRGNAFQVRPSKANALLAAALGATSDPSNGNDLYMAVSAHRIRGSWGPIDAVSTPAGEIYTANEPAFARANVIIVNKQVFDGMSQNQQQQLRQAAGQTRDWMASRHVQPAVSAAAYCAQNGGTIVIASPAQLDAMHQATAPVVAQLEADPLAAKVIARIRDIKASMPPPTTPSACAAVSPDGLPTPVLAARGDQTLIDGVWRLEVSEQKLRDARASGVDAASNGVDPASNAGIWTWTFKNGLTTWAEPRGRTCKATYTLDNGHFLMANLTPVGCDLVLPLTVKRDGDRLTLTPEPGTPPGIPVEGQPDRYIPDPVGFSEAFWSAPLVRVGDAP